MNTLAINGQDIAIKEYQGQRVVTFKEIDQVHQRPNGTAGRNFRSNHNHFVEGVDYFQLSYEEARSTNFVERPNSQGLTLLTETGYLMLVKSLRKILQNLLTFCNAYINIKCVTESR